MARRPRAIRSDVVVASKVAASKVAASMLAASMVAASMVAAAAGCTPEPSERPPVQLSLQLATRQSCGILSGLDYETSCLAAVYVRVFDETRTQIHEECRVLDQRPAELREMLRGEPLLRFAKLSTHQVVTFEVRGLHDVELDEGETAATLCQRPARTSHWLFWGESEPVDLRALDDKTGAVIPVVIDCRDCTFACGDQECFGCPGVGLPQCSADFPSSFCVPTASCDKSCDDDDDCFEGTRQCVEGRCDTSQVTGGLCSPCGDGGASCGEGLTCVATTANEPGFCAPPCPDEVCASGTKCNRLGNDLVLKD